MPDIEKDLQDILAARYGREVRDSIHDAIRDINEVVDGNVGTVTAITERAENAASRAETSAQSTDVYAQRAENAANNAKASETEATRLATEVLPESVQAGQKALTDATTAHLSDLQNQFNTDIAALGSKVIEAESYTKGGTGSRPGEDTDNAKYYMEEAKKAAGGDYIPRSEKGSPSGVATLGADGKIPSSQINGETYTTEEKTKLSGIATGANKTTVDSALSTTSTNPIQNKIITAEINTLKKSVSDGKTLVANAITEKGVETATDATFAVMAENISLIETGGGELHGATLSITTEETTLFNKTCYLKLGDATVQSKTISNTGVCTFTDILEVGEYEVCASDGVSEADITIPIAMEDIFLKNVIVKTLSFIKIVTFADGTWEQIGEMLNAHYKGQIEISDYWAVGDTKTVSLSKITATSNGEAHTSQDIELVIVGLNHDNLSTGEKSAITVQQKNCLLEAGYIDSSDVGIGRTKWADSLRRSWCNDTYFNALPSGLRQMIKYVYKESLYYNSQTTTDLATTTDRVFLVSVGEVIGSSDGTQYPYYVSKSNRIKLLSSTDSYLKNMWWTRTGAYYAPNNSARFHTINSSGNGDNVMLYHKLGIAPAFCL